MNELIGNSFTEFPDTSSTKLYTLPFKNSTLDFCHLPKITPDNQKSLQRLHIYKKDYFHPHKKYPKGKCLLGKADRSRFCLTGDVNRGRCSFSQCICVCAVRVFHRVGACTDRCFAQPFLFVSARALRFLRNF